jgi:hypothetical protein
MTIDGSGSSCACWPTPLHQRRRVLRDGSSTSTSSSPGSSARPHAPGVRDGAQLYNVRILRRERIVPLRRHAKPGLADDRRGQRGCSPRLSLFKPSAPAFPIAYRSTRAASAAMMSLQLPHHPRRHRHEPPGAVTCDRAPVPDAPLRLRHPSRLRVLAALTKTTWTSTSRCSTQRRKDRRRRLEDVDAPRRRQYESSGRVSRPTTPSTRRRCLHVHRVCKTWG